MNERMVDERGWEYDVSPGGVRCFYPTPEQWSASRDAACADIGLTWDKLAASVEECGCCLDLPDSIEHRANSIWFTYSP